MASRTILTQDKIHLTPKGLSQLEEELEKLIKQKRPRVVARLANARSQGDLSENSDYHDAREELALLDSRIAELESISSRASLIQNIPGNHQKDIVLLGSQVTVEAKNQLIKYELVGEWEANPMAKKISDKSPLGAALLGRKVGDEVKIEAPAGNIIYKIIKID